MKKKIEIKQSLDNEVPLEILATSIVSMSDGMKRLMNGKQFYRNRTKLFI